MKIEYFSKTSVKSVLCEEFKIPFSDEHGMDFYVNDEFLNGESEKDGIGFYIDFSENTDEVIISVRVENKTNADIKVENLGIRLGIDTYMEKYPEWNDKFFPTMLRCEKTHFWGYFQSPLKKTFAIVVTEPVASYHLEYNKESEKHFGHRIYTACLDFFRSGKLPERNPKQSVLKAGGSYNFNIHMIPLRCETEFEEKVSMLCGIPVIQASKYTLEKNDIFDFNVYENKDYDYEIIAPDGNKMKKGDRTKVYGAHKLVVKNSDGKIAESIFFVRKPWDFYLKAARSEAWEKPQRAATHTESWYGFFSAFLAQKHYPDKELDEKLTALFEEILPLIVDVENVIPLTAPTRIQNTSGLISVLVDKYEADRKNNKKYLELASKFGDFLMKSQADDGAYRNKSVHYTCVIYIAKSILELVLAERGEEDFKQKAEEHYNSVKRAIDELLRNLECIGTEGEHTLEDGMISCSALQLGCFALNLQENEREPYIKAAEYMINLHSCLEQNKVPDARINGCSLRFWEAQYDVLFKANFMNSPHGWSAWTIYAKYYLYMLTGKVKYLKEAANAMGACVQLMDLNGNLRWAFCVEPYIVGSEFVKCEDKPEIDGYSSLKLDTPNFRGEFEDGKVLGEEYVPMISGWFRPGKEKIMGGYDTCPFINRFGEYEWIDNQGGCCDNDVHEIFKCLEETFLNKAFCVKDEDGKLYTLGCFIENDELYIPKTSKLYMNFEDIKMRKNYI